MWRMGVQTEMDADDTRCSEMMSDLRPNWTTPGNNSPGAPITQPRLTSHGKCTEDRDRGAQRVNVGPYSPLPHA
jgi:hypothetical protein